MGGKHSQRLLTPLHYCANGMIVPPRSVARSLDLSVCAASTGSQPAGDGGGGGGGGGVASLMSLMCSKHPRTPTRAFTFKDGAKYLRC